MKTLRKNGGFTLVELIVVIAILAILAGVAVPAYSGYINKANEAADITTLDAVKTAAIAHHAENGDVTSITVSTANENDTIVKTNLSNDADICADNTDFATYFGGTKIVLKTGTSATWDGSEWTIN